MLTVSLERLDVVLFASRSIGTRIYFKRRP